MPRPLRAAGSLRHTRVGGLTGLGLGLMACSLIACERPPEVETSVRVGERLEVSAHPWANEPDPERENPELDAAREVLAALGDDWARRYPAAEAPDPAQLDPLAATVNVTEPPSTVEEYEELLAQLRDGPIDEIALPAHNLRQLSPELWPQLRELLLGPRKGSKTEFKRILSIIGGDVPNRYGHFALNWKRNHGYKVKLSEDWFKDLLSLPLGKVSSMLHPVYRDAVLTVAAMHGAAHIGRTAPELTGDVVEALLDAAYMHRGTFRDEVGRAIQSIGDEAVPHLVRASATPERGREDSEPHLRARYATYNLDQLDRLAPDRALASASSEPRRLIALLDAYGATRPGDAAAHILERVDDPAPAVRMAARAALEAYVTGPPPRMKTRSVRRLGGQTVRRQAYLSYRALAANALRSKLESEAPDLLEEACETRREDGSYNQRCIEQPARHAQAWFAHLDEARRQAQSKALASSLATAENDLQKAADQLALMVRDGSVLAGSEDALAVIDVLLQAAASADDPIAQAERLRAAAPLLDHHEPGRATLLRARALRLEAQSAELHERGRNMLLDQAQAMAPESTPSGLDESQDGPDPEASTAAPRERLGLSLLYVMLAFVCLTFVGARLNRGRASTV